MKNVLFYGNCQIGKLMDMLCLPSSSYNNTYIPCFSTNCSSIEFDTILKQSDIIITQPIHDNYRDKNYLASHYVVNNCKQNSIIIFINNCHFDFYYFDLCYNKLDKYCHSYMMECFDKKLDVFNYKNNYVENNNLKSLDELSGIFNKTIVELNSRYQDMLKYKKNNTYFINIIPFIQNNYKDKLLFYTFNHPSKYLLQYIALEIINILHIPNTIDNNLDPFSDERCILYSCIQKMVNFDIKKHTPCMNNCSNVNDIFHNTKTELQM
jgi:hypothetical protein